MLATRLLAAANFDFAVRQFAGYDPALRGPLFALIRGRGYSILFVALEGLMRFLSLRAMFLLGFVVAMPVLALPTVARRIDELLYGPPPADFGRAPLAAAPTEEPVHSQPVAHVAPAQFNEPSPAASSMATTGFESTIGPPALAPTPQFAPPSPPPMNAAAVPPEAKIEERTIARLQQIRQRLEQLGAEYVVVETQDGGRYRFHCRMLLDPHSRFTRPFEAASFDCLAAGEQVLREVEAWRNAGMAQPIGAAR